MSFGTQLNLFLNLVSMVYFHHVPVFSIKTEDEEGWALEGWALILLCAFMPFRQPRIAMALILLSCVFPRYPR